MCHIGFLALNCNSADINKYHLSIILFYIFSKIVFFEKNWNELDQQLLPFKFHGRNMKYTLSYLPVVSSELKEPIFNVDHVCR